MRLTGNGSEFSLYGTWHGPQFITTSPVDLKIVKKQPDNDSVKVHMNAYFQKLENTVRYRHIVTPYSY